MYKMNALMFPPSVFLKNVRVKIHSIHSFACVLIIVFQFKIYCFITFSNPIHFAKVLTIYFYKKGKKGKNSFKHAN